MIAFSWRYVLTSQHTLKHCIFDCSPRHTNRTFHNYNIFFTSFDIRLFIPDICVTFFCRDKPCSHLYCLNSQIQYMFHFLRCVNPSCHRNRNLCVILFRITIDCLLNVSDLMGIFFICIIRKFFFLKTKMSAGFWSFNDHHICRSSIFSIPIF